MRLRFAVVLTLTFCAGCTPPFGNNANNGRAPDSRSGGVAGGATVTIAATSANPCSASWDGQAVTPVQITERGIALIERAIAAAGGIQNLTETSLPTPDVEAPADLSFACADTVLFALQRSGIASVRLKPAGGQAPVLADFPLDMNLPAPPIPMVLGIGAGGRMTWNDDPIDAAALAAQLGRIGRTDPSEARGGGSSGWPGVAHRARGHVRPGLWAIEDDQQTSSAPPRVPAVRRGGRGAAGGGAPARARSARRQAIAARLVRTDPSRCWRRGARAVMAATGGGRSRHALVEIKRRSGRRMVERGFRASASVPARAGL